MTSTHNPYAKADQALRRMRQKIWDYDGTPKEEQAKHVLYYLKQRVIRSRRYTRQHEERGPYSALTRRELRATGTCETDWF